MSVGYRHCHGLMAAGCHCRDHVQPRRTAQESRSRAKGPANPRALRRNFWVADGHVPNAKQDGNHCVPALPLWRWWLAWHIRHANRTVLRVLRTPELGNSNFANVLRLHGFAYGDFLFSPSSEWIPFDLRTFFTVPGEANPRLALPAYVDMEPWLHWSLLSHCHPHLLICRHCHVIVTCFDFSNKSKLTFYYVIVMCSCVWDFPDFPQMDSFCSFPCSRHLRPWWPTTKPLEAEWKASWRMLHWAIIQIATTRM